MSFKLELIFKQNLLNSKKYQNYVWKFFCIIFNWINSANTRDNDCSFYEQQPENEFMQSQVDVTQLKSSVIEFLRQIRIIWNPNEWHICTSLSCDRRCKNFSEGLQKNYIAILNVCGSDDAWKLRIFNLLLLCTTWSMQTL